MSTASRNPGPRWGFRFLRVVNRREIRGLVRPALGLGTWVAVLGMAEARAHSRRYLALALGRPPTLTDVWRHFFSFLEFLLLRLRAGSGEPVRCIVDPATGGEFESLRASGAPALFGTFHFGNSDLLGFLLGRRDRHVAMVRLRVGNSDDTRWLQQQFNEWLSIIWVNEPADLVFALKTAIEEGRSLALQCDRAEYSARLAEFEFLGGRRVFPVTIYHLAVLFGRPVSFCFGVPEADGVTKVVASRVYRPDPAASRAENLGRAHEHFQGVLRQVEALVRQHPFLWFNFRELTSSAPRAGTSTPHAVQRV